MISAEDIRKSMRITHDKLDIEIKRNIDTCLLDLQRVGVNTETESVLLDKACELYCKAQFNYQGKAEEYQANYEKTRDGMSLASEYRENTEGDANV